MYLTYYERFIVFKTNKSQKKALRLWIIINNLPTVDVQRQRRVKDLEGQVVGKRYSIHITIYYLYDNITFSCNKIRYFVFNEMINWCNKNDKIINMLFDYYQLKKNLYLYIFISKLNTGTCNIKTKIKFLIRYLSVFSGFVSQIRTNA